MSMWEPMFDPDQWKAKQEKKEMEAHQHSHELFGFILGLDCEGLAAIQRLGYGLANSGEKAAMYALYYAGVAEALRSERHGFCLACGKNHDEELGALATEEP